MLSFNNYRRCDALELAERVRKRKVSPRELLDAALARPWFRRYPGL